MCLRVCEMCEGTGSIAHNPCKPLCGWEMTTCPAYHGKGCLEPTMTVEMVEAIRTQEGGIVEPGWPSASVIR